jgi:hypothetical protein
MPALTFDTLKFARRLKEESSDLRLAKAILGWLRDTLSQAALRLGNRQARLLRLSLKAPTEQAEAFPSLEEFQAQVDPEGEFSETAASHGIAPFYPDKKDTICESCPCCEATLPAILSQRPPHTPPSHPWPSAVPRLHAMALSLPPCAARHPACAARRLHFFLFSLSFFLPPRPYNPSPTPFQNHRGRYWLRH